jgi:hypothetical protein
MRLPDMSKGAMLVGNVILLFRLAKIPSSATVEYEILYRIKKVPESGFDSRPGVVWRTGPPAQRGLHT